MPTTKSRRPKQTPTQTPKQKQTIPQDVFATVVDALATALVEDLERNKVMDNGTHIGTIPPTPREGSERCER